MNGKHIIARTIMAASVLLGASACGSRYDAVEIQRVAGHHHAHGSSDGFSVPEGTLFVFEVDPKAAAGRSDFEVTDKLELVTRDGAVARIEQGLASGTWMLLGIAEGQTVVELWINGELEDAIPVDVTAQEVSS